MLGVQEMDIAEDKEPKKILRQPVLQQILFKKEKNDRR